MSNGDVLEPALRVTTSNGEWLRSVCRARKCDNLNSLGTPSKQ